MKVNATTHMLMWNPRTGDVLLEEHPMKYHRHRDYNSTLACWSYIHDLTAEQRKLIVFIEAMHLIVRDGIDPVKLHHVLLDLEEYRDGCAADMPGAAEAMHKHREEVPGPFDMVVEHYQRKRPKRLQAPK